jgi:hypothetical protein
VNIGNTTTPDQLRTRQQVRSQFESALNEQARAKGRELTTAEKRAVTDDLVKETVFTVKGTVWDSTKTKVAVSITMDDVKSAVPKSDIQQITAGFAARGITPTPAQIIEMYNRKSSK